MAWLKWLSGIPPTSVGSSATYRSVLIAIIHILKIHARRPHLHLCVCLYVEADIGKSVEL